MIYEKSARGLPPLKITKLSKKAQERQNLIQKNLFEANRCYNDCKFQLNWNNLEWVDPKSNPKRVKPYSVSSKRKLVKVIEKLILLVILD